MTGVLYRGVQKFCPGKKIIITTQTTVIYINIISSNAAYNQQLTVLESLKTGHDATSRTTLLPI